MLSIICKYFTGHATSGFGATSAGGTSTKFNPVIGTHFENLNVGQQVTRKKNNFVFVYFFDFSY